MSELGERAAGEDGDRGTGDDRDGNGDSGRGTARIRDEVGERCAGNGDDRGDCTGDGAVDNVRKETEAVNMPSAMY